MQTMNLAYYKNVSTKAVGTRLPQRIPLQTHYTIAEFNLLSSTIKSTYVCIFMPLQFSCELKFSKVRLDLIHLGRSQSERFLQHSVLDARPEQRCRLCLHTRVLAVQCGDGKGWACAHVELEVQKTPREHKHIADVHSCGKQLLAGAHEPHQQRALNHDQDLSSPGVCVGCDETSYSEVETCHGDAQSVEAGKLSRECWSDCTSGSVCGVSSSGQASEHEVIYCHSCGTLAHQTIDDGGAGHDANAEVLFWVGIRCHRRHG